MNTGFAPEKRCLVGVSGGRDSVALLHQLHTAGFADLIVCHLDHGLRPESATDARFVADLATQFGYEVVLERQDIGALARQTHKSLETAARDARYALFARVARERECPRLFLAHHADDQVKTFFFNLFRGAATGGLAGMEVMSTRLIDGVSLRIARPMLGVWREDIDAYIARHHLSYVEDASNADPRFTRNRVRHEIIPAMEESFGRDIRRAIWRTAEILRAEDEFLSGLVDRANMPPELGAAELHAEPVALQRRRLHAWLRLHGVPNVGFAEVEIARALAAGRTAKGNLPGGWHVRRRAGKLFLEPPRHGLSH